MAARLVKALGHGSIFAWLGMSLVSLSNCGGSVVEYTGYEALRGVPFPAGAFQIAVGEYPDFGHDWWVAGVMALAVFGIGSAVLGGVRGAFVGIGVSIAGLVVLSQAVGFFADPTGQSWTPQYAAGSSTIADIYVGSVVLDLAWMAVRSIAEVRRTKRTPSSDRAEWLALAIFSVSFLSLISLAGLGLVGLILMLRASG
jgi:hypothetical protein